MKRIKLVLVPTVSAAILSLTACEKHPDAARVCVDENHVRVADGECGSTTHGGGAYVYRWYYLSRDTYAPGVGGYVTGGSDTPMAETSYGSAAERGGFGAEGGHGFFGGFGE